MATTEPTEHADSDTAVAEPAAVDAKPFVDLNDVDACAAFAEEARARLAALIGGVETAPVAETLSDCQALLVRLSERLAALDIAALEPRRGLAGLSDSRAGRLRAFRAAYSSAETAAADTAVALATHAEDITKRQTASGTFWTRTRDAIAELDPHIAAARAWLTDHKDTGRGGGVEEPPSDPPQDAVVTQPHPLEVRLTALAALRSAAVAHLARLRAEANAEHRLPEALARVQQSLSSWRMDWQDALGLVGRRPRRVRPDAARLQEARTVVLQKIEAAIREVRSAITRHAELQARTPAPTGSPRV